MKTRFRAAAAAIVMTFGVVALPGPAGATDLGEDTTEWATRRCHVEALYPAFFSRSASAADATYWSQSLTSSSTSSVATSFAGTVEWKDRMVKDLFQQALGRTPTATELSTYSPQVSKNSPLDPIAAAIFAKIRTELVSTNSAYVTALYDAILDRVPTSGESSAMLADMTGGATAADVAEDLWAGQESRNIRVQKLYQKVLNRVAEPAGEAYWANELLTKNDVQLTISLASSSEFRTNSLNACTKPYDPYYPIDLTVPSTAPTTDPAYTIDTALLDSGRSCTTYSSSSSWKTIILVGPPEDDAATDWRGDADWVTRFTGTAKKVCVIDIPDTGQTQYDDDDLARTAEYVARAVHQEASTSAGSKVNIIAHEAGGLSARWAMRFWPQIRSKVDDVVLIGTPNHGSVDAMYDADTTPTPSSQQSRADSAFIEALNSPISTGGDETPGGSVSYTNIASANDRISVGDGVRDSRESAWHLSGARNIRVQNTCNTATIRRPAVRDHAWVWEAVRDALLNSGMTSTTRVTDATCASSADADGSASVGTTVAPNSEPPLPGYVPVIAEETPAWKASSSDPDVEYEAPSHPTNPALTEEGGSESAIVAKAKVCSDGGEVRYAEAPTLLVPGGAGTDGGSMFRQLMDLPAFSSTPTGAKVHPVCWLKHPYPTEGEVVGASFDPDTPSVDLVRSAEYVVAVVLDLKATATTPKVDIIAHSRGGYDVAWALTWWTDVQAKVDDAVFLDTPLRGSGAQRYGTYSQPTDLMATPMGQQSRSDSHFVAALLAGGAATSSWTTIQTWDETTVHRNAYDHRQNAWRWPGATNVMVQQHCAGNRVTHGQMFSDTWVRAALLDALANTGGTNPARISDETGAICKGDWKQLPRQELATGGVIQPDEEPTLPAYVPVAP